jgi:hypothetical protein
MLEGARPLAKRSMPYSVSHRFVAPLVLLVASGLAHAARAQDDSDRPHLKSQDSSSQQQNQQQPEDQRQDQSTTSPSAASSTAKSEDQSSEPRTRGDDAVVPNALPRGKKLILADGSFQLVREYQRQGDRVRYYSVERSAWEDIPASLVDWAATQKSEANDQAHDKELTEKIKASQLAARTAGVNTDRSYEVRPGVILPDEAGLYVLDSSKILLLEQNQGESHLDKGREVAKIVTGVPLIDSKHRVDLPGKYAKLRIHSTDPEFYFRPVDGRAPHIFLLKLDVIGDKRSVESVKTNVADISKFKAHEISLLSWDAAKGLTRFTVEEKLQPGEYAITESRPDGEIDLYVWDFGVDAGPGE